MRAVDSLARPAKRNKKLYCAIVDRGEATLHTTGLLQHLATVRLPTDSEALEK